MIFTCSTWCRLTLCVSSHVYLAFYVSRQHHDGYPWVIQLSLLSLPSRDQYRYAVYRHCWRTASDSISTEDRHLCEFYDYVPLAQCPIIVSNRSDPISSENAIFTFTWDHTDQTTDQLIAPLCQLISHNLAFWWGIIMNRCRKHFSNPRQQTLVSCSIKHRETHHQAYGGSCARLSRTSECENEAPEVGRLFALSDGKFSDRWPRMLTKLQTISSNVLCSMFYACLRCGYRCNVIIDQ